MGSSFQLALCLGMLALSFASPINTVRWCVKSRAELDKCKELANTCSTGEVTLTCVQKQDALTCCDAIANGEADAISLDSGEVYKCSLNPYNLKPVAAENYGTAEAPDTCYYAVALVDKTTNFQFKDLKGKKSCHTAVGRAAGWVAPVGQLVAKHNISWDGPESQAVEKAVAEFFSSSCAPGSKHPNLCKLCKGPGAKKCDASEVNSYFGYAGAYKCLEDGAADVSFVKHILPAEASKKFELLCLDNQRRQISDYKNCHTGRIPSHAVVTQDKEEKIKAVTKFLEEAQKKEGCNLFSSTKGKDLMFKSSATGLLPVPEKMDAYLYLGQRLMEANQALRIKKENPPQDSIRWCTQSKDETTKCDKWSSFNNGAITCIEASNAEECITKILKGEADAATLDGGYLYTAGKCGLIPVMQEIYDAKECDNKNIDKKGSYFAVAIAKTKDKDVTWKNLKDKKSCHTGKGRTAGYNVPVGLIVAETKNCDISTFFKESCIPGADPNSNLCSLCKGNPDKSRNTKCFANSQEQYYGYAGALRCLFEEGQVAFAKHTTPDDVLSSQNRPDWAKDWQKSDLELICPDGTRKPVDQYKDCNLAEVPSHAVVTNPDRKDVVLQILSEQLDKFGRRGSEQEKFQMFLSEGTRDQLFKDSTQCLARVNKKNMKDFLGDKYYNSISALNECGKSGLLAACTFHTCKL